MNGLSNLTGRIGLTEQIRADVGLILLTLIWGSSFSLVKTALQDVTPMLFLALRFWIGVGILTGLLYRRGLSVSAKAWVQGSILGLFMFLGMGLQTLGLKYTTASRSGFITGLAVVFVPFIVFAAERRMPKRLTVFGVLLAVAGIYALTSPRGGGLNTGDWLTLGSAFSFAFQIVYVEKFGKQNDTLSLTVIMLFVTAIMASISAAFFEGSAVIVSARMLIPLLLTATLSTALGFYMQLYWQPQTSATAAAVIYTMEPVFAAMFAMIFMGDRLTLTGWFGAVLIISGMILAELRK